MVASRLLIRVLVLSLVLGLVLAAPSWAQSGSDDEEDGEDDRSGRRGGDRSGPSATGRPAGTDGPDGDRPDGRDADDRDRRGPPGAGDADRPNSVSRQVGRLSHDDGAVSGRFVAFHLTETGIADFAYRGNIVFEGIHFDPALEADDITVRGARYTIEGDDTRFEGADTPAGHFRARADDGTLRFTLASGYVATPRDDRSGHGSAQVQIEGDGFTALLQGGNLTVDGGTIIADREARFTVHAPALRGHLSPKIGSAAEDGRIGAEVLVSRNVTADESVAVPHGPYDLSLAQSHGNVTLIIEGHGNGTVVLFDLERDALGRIEDLVIRFDGLEILSADDLEDILDVAPGEPPESLIVVGREKAQVLVSVPSFSVHTVHLSSLSAGPVEVLGPILGSPLVALAAAAVAGLFVVVSWNIRNRQR